MRRLPRTRLLAGVVLAGLVVACGSPNRGHWEGTFDGNVSGTMAFDISAFGKQLEGKMSGATRDGQPFEAELEGRVEGDHFFAEFAGLSRAGALPVAFEGLLKGSLANGSGGGDWTCTLRFNRARMKGTWEASRQP